MEKHKTKNDGTVKVDKERQRLQRQLERLVRRLTVNVEIGNDLVFAFYGKTKMFHIGRRKKMALLAIQSVLVKMLENTNMLLLDLESLPMNIFRENKI